MTDSGLALDTTTRLTASSAVTTARGTTITTPPATPTTITVCASSRNFIMTGAATVSPAVSENVKFRERANPRRGDMSAQPKHKSKPEAGPSQKDAPATQSLFDRMMAPALMAEAYKRTRCGQRKFRPEAIAFDRYAEHYLARLRADLESGQYRPCGYTQFMVYEPKERLIHAPRVRDKVVQYAVHRVLEEVYGPVFIADSFACRRGKGEHKAIDQAQHYMRLCRRQHGGGWLLKLDVKKFFYSIDRDILKGVYRKRIKEGRFLAVLDAIVDSSPCGPVGVPLGNATSQNFANVVLDQLDQYAKRWLKIKWYVRYMDDVICVFPTKEEARRAKALLSDFLAERLNLTAHPKKTKIFPLAQGVNAYGFRIYASHRLIRQESKARMKRKLKAMLRHLAALPQAERAEYRDFKARISINSWLGFAFHGNDFNLCRKLFHKLKWVKVERKGFFYGRRPKPQGWTPQANTRPKPQKESE